MMKDKTTIIVVVACLVALFAWNKVVDQLYPPTPKRTGPAKISSTTNAVPGNAREPAASGQTLRNPSAATPAAPTAPGATEPRPPEQLAVLQNEFIRVQFTTWGGGIRTVELLKHKANAESNVQLNDTNAAPALAIRDLPGAGAEAAYSLERPDARTVILRARTPAGIEVTKKFSLGDGYLLQGTVEVVPGSTNGLTLVIGTATSTTALEPPDLLSVGWLSGSKYLSRAVKVVQKNETRALDREPADARWVAVKNQFFTLLLNPATNVITVGYHVLELPAPPDWKRKQPPQGLQAWAAFAPTTTTSDAQRYTFTYYAGPKEYKRLAALGDGEEEVMDLGTWMDFHSGIFGVVLLRGLNLFYSLIPNYGVAIILITIVIKIIFWPIQAKSIRSMKEMQKFQPLMAKLREKYKDEPQRMNTEMMKLYKEHKVNPFAGCLPMVVQIPVFFAFYTMLRSAIELRGASFLWIKDLSQPDTIGHLAGFPLNPLPLLMGVSMIGQMKLTPSAGDPKQQQMMMFMPLMFLFICYNMSSGLVLYWTVQQVLSIAQQWWSLKHHSPTNPLAPAGALVRPK